MKKVWLVVGIILLFVGSSCSPVITAEKIQERVTLNQSLEKTFVRVYCYKYEPEGVVKKTVIFLPKSQYLKMTHALSLTSSMDQRLEVYKTYGILSSNESVQRIKEQYTQYLLMQKINVSSIQEYFIRLKTEFPRIVVNLNCKVEAHGQSGININLGTNAITQLWNAITLHYYLIHGIPPVYLPGVDLGAFCLGVYGLVDVKDGIFPDQWQRLGVFAFLLLGFVGYYIETIPLPIVFYGGNSYFGYSVVVLAIGLYQPEYLTFKNITI